MSEPNKQAIDYIHEEQHDRFNALADAASGQIDVSGGSFRGHSLRAFHLKNANLSGCYFRNADLRGLDLSEANMEGATIRDAKVSGVLFPKNLSADEIRLSLEFGTRLRQG